MKTKRGAMELTMGTMVTIVLLVAALILGGVLVKNIFKSASGAVDLTDQQLREEINKLFSEEKEIAIYPPTRFVEIKQETTDGVGIGIKNLLQGVSGSPSFSYVIEVEDGSNCGISDEQIKNWITVGGHADSLTIPVGDMVTRKVLFNIPTGTPLCTARFSVNVYYGEGKPYESDFFDVKVKAK